MHKISFKLFSGNARRAMLVFTAERLSAGNGCNNKEENKANQRIYKAISMAIKR